MKFVVGMLSVVVVVFLGFEFKKHQTHGKMVLKNLEEQDRNIEQLLEDINRLERALTALKH
ncbi:hypothetical protein [Helicobacter cetorum]|uniref:hypothetical protein n=1 Tax=Helicobacter cetorum TaxID=138563 RepID=UPI000CF18FA9|nr:hypothetical protein [Helicobacter cetorum]